MAALEFIVILGCALLVSGALAHRLRVAAPVLQLAAGVALGFVPTLRETELPPDVLLLVFLPVLLYWESVTTSLRAIRRDLRGIVLTGTLLVAVAAWAVTGWSRCNSRQPSPRAAPPSCPELSSTSARCWTAARSRSKIPSAAQRRRVRARSARARAAPADPSRAPRCGT